MASASRGSRTGPGTRSAALGTDARSLCPAVSTLDDSTSNPPSEVVHGLVYGRVGTGPLSTPSPPEIPRTFFPPT